MAGYSGTPLAKKLGLKDGFKVRLIHPPKYYWKLFSDLPDVRETTRAPYDFIHLFTTKRQELAKELPKLLKQITRDGMIWVSWPKKSSGVATDITEDTIRAECLPMGLVDVKVCAVDETWSGLKLVIRKELR
jgi:hypothetical protein